jgi:hypothetical protein
MWLQELDCLTPLRLPNPYDTGIAQRTKAAFLESLGDGTPLVEFQSRGNDDIGIRRQ